MGSTKMQSMQRGMTGMQRMQRGRTTSKVCKDSSFYADLPPHTPRIKKTLPKLSEAFSLLASASLLNMTSLHFRFLAFISEAIEWAAFSSKNTTHLPFDTVFSPSTLYWLPPLLQLSIIFVGFLVQEELKIVFSYTRHVELKISVSSYTHMWSQSIHT